MSESNAELVKTNRTVLEPLNFAIQYRRKDNGMIWRTMAAFDVQGPAEWYLKQQSGDLPWEYRLVELTSPLGKDE